MLASHELALYVRIASAAAFVAMTRGQQLHVMLRRKHRVSSAGGSET